MHKFAAKLRESRFCVTSARKVSSVSSEAQDWKPRVVSEAEQVLVKESAEAAHRTTEVQEAMDKQLQALGD